MGLLWYWLSRELSIRALGVFKRILDRLMAIHLHDNGGAREQHQLPFDGDINWYNVMNGISSDYLFI
jgi:sugar phosphate isomerase/epimerase